MPNKFLSASLAVAMALAGPACSQNSSPACNHTKAVMNHAQGPDSTTSMANTSSDGGMTSTGASSAAIGTGPTDKMGVNNPCVTAGAAHGASGALPNSTPNTP